jgi:hypothetical protein
MKSMFHLLVLCGILLLGGCAISEQSVDEVGQQFQEGIQGRGRIVPNDPMTDSFGSNYR